MSVRNLLHFKHLGNFILWCKSNSIEIDYPTGDWQVLKVKTTKGWDGIYIKREAREHFSMSDSVGSIVRKFYRDVTI